MSEYFNEQLTRAMHTLRRRDAVLRPIIKAHGRPSFHPHDDYFETLVDSIISQQISGSAARTIMQRTRDAVGGLLAPDRVEQVPDEILRAAGVSSQKLGYLRSLCNHIEDGSLELLRLAELPDDEVISELTAVKGIGIWTAQMFLIFSLGRLDVLPTSDLGVQRGARNAYGLPELPTARQLADLAEQQRWAPYRSVASWYLWRAS